MNLHKKADQTCDKGHDADCSDVKCDQGRRSFPALSSQEPGHPGRNAFLESEHTSSQYVNFSTEKIIPGEQMGTTIHVPTALGWTAMRQEGLHPFVYPGELVVRDDVLATRLFDCCRWSTTICPQRSLGIPAVHSSTAMCSSVHSHPTWDEIQRLGEKKVNFPPHNKQCGDLCRALGHGLRVCSWNTS